MLIYQIIKYYNEKLSLIYYNKILARNNNIRIFEMSLLNNQISNIK